MSSDIRHGTTTAYSHHKCRCSECRAAVAEYNRKRAQAKRAGTWQPIKGRPTERQMCTGPGCDRVARHLTPQPLCESHYQQVHVRRVPLAPVQRRRLAKDGVKQCTRCDEFKPLAEFYKKLNGTTPACKKCQSIINRVTKYGIPFAEMKALLEQPCSGCGAEVKGREQHIDHCHDTGRVRGILCHNCNTVLTVHMTPEKLRRLADYLER